ncbi:hypothetical protein VNO80_01416 [Phaseolus coccineus]|uniref:Carrier domain-containing protein n=1 Tax=Phaseolus coccineus TaxID=3886 RepID=A0AAN9RSU3_PHACN
MKSPIAYDVHDRQSPMVYMIAEKSTSPSIREDLVKEKPETVKVCDIVKKQLALPEDSTVKEESKFAALGADSLDTVLSY